MNLPISARVPTGAAGDDAHLPEGGEFGGGDLHLLQEDAPGLLPDAAERGIAHGARLLEDLLQHEMLVAALFRFDRVPEDALHLALHGPAFEIGQPYSFGGQDGEIAVAQEEHVLGVREYGRNVAGHEVFVVADADHDGRAIARRHDLVGVLPGDHDQREDAGQLLDGDAHGLFEVALEVLLDQVGDDFGVGLGLEDVAFHLQLFFERQVVFDDAVVHYDEIALAVAVRVGVLFGRPAVSGPTGVADAEGAVHRVHPDRFFQVAEFALGAAYRQLFVITVDRKPGRIVAAVFQTLQPLQDNRDRTMRSDIADDAAHIPTL